LAHWDRFSTSHVPAANNIFKGMEMRFGVFYELQLPRPWNQGDERNLFHQALQQVEIADRLGYD